MKEVVCFEDTELTDPFCGNQGRLHGGGVCREQHEGEAFCLASKDPFQALSVEVMSPW